MSKYSLTDLIKVFDEHDREYEEINKRLIQEFKETNPDEPLPEHFKDEFRLPLALKTICEEILDIKKNYK